MYARKSDGAKAEYKTIDHDYVQAKFKDEPLVVMTWAEFWQTVTIPK